MDTQKPNIDEYFEAARNSKPVFSINEINDLISAENNGQIQPSTGIKITKGVKPMHILATAVTAAAAIGIIGIGISTFEDNNDFNIRENQNSNLAKQQNDIKESAPQKIQGKISSVQDFNTNVSDMKKIDVKGVNIIALSKGELERLGIRANSDGSLQFAALKETKNPLVVKLSKNELTTIIGSEDADKLPNVSPRFITDDNGNRRLSLFSEKDEGSLVQAYYAQMYEVNNDGNRKSQRQTPAFNIEFDDEDSNNKSKTKIEIVHDNKKDNFVYKYLIKDGDSLMVANEITSSYDPNLKATVHKIESNEELMKMADRKIILNDLGKDCTKYLQASKNYYDIINHFANKAILEYKLAEKYRDSIVEPSKKCFENEITINLSSIKNLIDSIAKDINNNLKNSAKARIKIESKKKHKTDNEEKDIDKIIIDNDIEINIDSIMKNVESQLHNIEKFLDVNDIKIDTLKIKHLEKKLKKTEEKLKLKDEKFKQLDKKMKEMLEQIEKNFENYIRINKLIPIAIKFDDNPDNVKFDYILWFDPVPELIEKLPAEIRQRLEPEIIAAKETKQFCEKGIIPGEVPYLDIWRSCSGAIENMSVFPNPTSGKMNIKFNLTENRFISIVLHDLSGKQIRTLQEGINLNQGEFEGKFQVKGLTPGMYLLSVQSSSGEYAVQRIIVQ